MNRMVAYCGIVCTDCPAYIATQADDRAALERVAAQWREEFNVPEITVESVICDGCLASNGARLAGYCSTCAIRACGVERDVVNCAHCAEYSCDKLDSFLSHGPDARKVLEEIRQSM
jgi:hypothetical protein